MTAAADLPVARVVVDSPLPHLDRLFDYSVPPELDEAAQPGVRVKVRFSGRLVAGFLIERAAASGHQGRLTPLASVVSAEQVLTTEVARLARAVADRYAGNLSDVLRLAIPPRHARVEAQTANAPSNPDTVNPDEPDKPDTVNPDEPDKPDTVNPDKPDKRDKADTINPDTVRPDTANPETVDLSTTATHPAAVKSARSGADVLATAVSDGQWGTYRTGAAFLRALR